MALSFNGSTQYVDVGNNLGFTSGSFTAMGWCRRNATGVRHEILSKEDTGAAGWALAILASNVAEFGAFNGSYQVVASPGTIGSGTRVHVAGVYDDPANQLRLYLDGALVATTSSVFVGPAASAQNLNIGRRPNNTRHFNGDIEDVRAYSRALSDAEISAIATARGRDYVLQNLDWRVPMIDLPAGSGPPAFLNLQSAASGTSGTTLPLAYTVPSSINKPLLVVCTSTRGTSTVKAPSSIVFGGNNLVLKGGTGTLTNPSSGAYVWCVPVTAGQSGTITPTWSTSVDGRMMHAFTLTNAFDTVHAQGSANTASGIASTSFTTTVANRFGFSYMGHITDKAATAAVGTNHFLTSQLTNGVGLAGILGGITVETPQAYTGLSFSFSGGPPVTNSSIVAIALDVLDATTVRDFAGSFPGTIVGATFAETLALQRMP